MTSQPKTRCPCCGGDVDIPSFDMIVQVAKISRDQEVVLRRIWDGKGRAVRTEAIFDAMYADDINGGPGRSQMYSALKLRLHRLREKLNGTGVEIQNAGYNGGYRLVINARD